MSLRILISSSAFLLLLGCPAAESPPPKESHYLQNQTQNDATDAGSSDGTTDGTSDGALVEDAGTSDGSTDGVADGNADGATDGAEVDAGPITGPGDGVDVHLGIGNITLGDPNTVEITIHTAEVLAGFQFELSGAVIASFSGGIAEQLSDDGWMVSASQLLVLGADLSGGAAPLGPADGILMILEIGTPSEDAICTGAAVMSDTNGVALVTTTECKPVP